MKPYLWTDLDLRHLVALQAVAEEGSFWGAAERLGCSQSAVSQQISALEAIVGERLIERSRGRRPVGLTEAGHLLMRHAEAIIAHLRALHADFSVFAAGAAGRLRVGTFQSVGAKVVPALLREYATSWPDVEVRLIEGISDNHLLPLVERGELDLSFALLPLPDGPFEAVELLEDPYVLAVPAGSSLASATPSLQELEGLPLIGFNQCRSVELVEAFLRARGIELRVVFRSDNNGTVQGLVRAGLGAALVPVLTLDERDRSVEIRALAQPVPSRRIVLAWHRDRYRSPASRAFAETAQRVCEQVQSGVRNGVA